MKKVFLWIGPLGWYLLITFLSHQKGGLYHYDLPIDKVVHFGLYFVLGILLFIPYNWTISKINILFLIILGCVLALLDEWHQYFIPGRVMSFFDWMADMIGYGTAILVKSKWRYKKGIIN